LRSARGTDAVDRLDQQVDQIVGQATSTQIDKGGQPGAPRRIGMPAQFMRCLDRYAPPDLRAAIFLLLLRICCCFGQALRKFQIVRLSVRP
jgi:hypothetical protein